MPRVKRPGRSFEIIQNILFDLRAILPGDHGAERILGLPIGWLLVRVGEQILAEPHLAAVADGHDRRGDKFEHDPVIRLFRNGEAVAGAQRPYEVAASQNSTTLFFRSMASKASTGTKFLYLTPLAQSALCVSGLSRSKMATPSASKVSPPAPSAAGLRQ